MGIRKNVEIGGDMTGTLKLTMDEDIPLREAVFRTLRRAILSGQLMPGERLMEVHLANMLGVSRTPVREAVRMLELEGLVNMPPQRGAVVAEITRSDLEDVLEVRLALEELAVRKACREITAPELEKLHRAAERFVQCVESNHLIESAEADEEFHELIGKATRNHRLIQILGNLREQIYRYRVENLKDCSSYPALIRQHDEIMNALDRRDEEAAAAAMRVHIDEQRNSIIGSLHME